MTIADLLALISAGGPTGLLVAMVVSLMRGNIITRGQYDDMLAEKQQRIDRAEQREAIWQQLALNGTAMAERAVAATVTAVSAAGAGNKPP